MIRGANPGGAGGARAPPIIWGETYFPPLLDVPVFKFLFEFFFLIVLRFWKKLSHKNAIKITWEKMTPLSLRILDRVHPQYESRFGAPVYSDILISHFS